LLPMQDEGTLLPTLQKLLDYIVGIQ
jgi:hypothetical protein